MSHLLREAIRLGGVPVCPACPAIEGLMDIQGKQWMAGHLALEHGQLIYHVLAGSEPEGAEDDD